MKRYEELEKAARLVDQRMLEIGKSFMVTPAFEKLARVKRYLLKQAGHVMEGRDEDGAEPKILCEYACIDCSVALEYEVLRCRECRMLKEEEENRRFCAAEDSEMAVLTGWESVDGGAMMRDGGGR